MTNTFIMGVSLGNKTFKGRFARSFAEYLKNEDAEEVVVFLGDCIERINYRVFGGYSEEKSVGVSLGRAENLRTMFLKSLGVDSAGLGDLSVLLESEIRRDPRYSARLDEARICLNACRDNPNFIADVDAQLHKNLTAKTSKFGVDFVVQEMPRLREYIFGELEVFYALYLVHNRVVECYPGAEMDVKDKFFSGFYDLSSCSNIPLVYEYRDVSVLVED